MKQPSDVRSLRNALLHCKNPQTLEQFFASLGACELAFLENDWLVWARDDQLPPHLLGEKKSWSTWLVLGGRGAGKTRTGAEWIKAQALGLSPLSLQKVGFIAIIGPSYHEARHIMVEGVSGILSVCAHLPQTQKPIFLSSKRQIIWPSGAKASLFSAEDPEELRGPQFEVAWADELAKWRYAEETWDMLQFGLRRGETPQVVVTTTPRPMPLLKKMLSDPSVSITHATTFANKANLSGFFLKKVEEKYGQSRLGRQELFGEFLEEDPNALFPRALIEKNRFTGEKPIFLRKVVAVDPPVSSHKDSDACGIICAGIDQQKRAYVLEDASLQGITPTVWAQKAINLYHKWQADRLIVEVNQGGEMVETIIHTLDRTVAFKPLRARQGKMIRAEPIAAFYERGLVHHCGFFPELEDELATFSPWGTFGKKSPDRADALIWALTELLLSSECSIPQIRKL